MTDQTNASLIAEAREAAKRADWYMTGESPLLRALADALEAADQRATELAAVVEKVRSVIERESGWFRYRAEQVSTVLASAPADALREHDAALLEGLADEVHATLSDPNRKRPRDPRGESATDLLNDVAWAVHLIREKARQRRGEKP